MRVSSLHLLRAVLLCAIVSALLAISGCSRNPDTETPTKVSGVVQKGPFLPGGTISAFPIRKDPGGQLGRADQQIDVTLGQDGSYEMEIPWQGPTDFEVTGRYQDELAREPSKRKTTLSATTDIQEDTQVNLNLFTTLAQQRTESLLADQSPDEETTYDAALTRANDDLNELLDLGLPDANSLHALDLVNRSETEDLEEANESLALFSAVVLQEYKAIIPVEEDGDDDGDDLPRLADGFIRDFADDGRINGPAFRDWERMVGNANLDLLAEADEGLRELGFSGDSRPVKEPPEWAERILISLHDPSYQQPNEEGLQELHVPVRLSAVSDEAVSVEFSIEPGTARADQDYLDPNGTDIRQLAQMLEDLNPMLEDGRVLFAPGEQVHIIKIPLLPSANGEPIGPRDSDVPNRLRAPKTFDIQLKAPEGARFGRDILHAAIPTETQDVRDDLELKELKLVALHDGDREIPLTGHQLYEQDGLLTASLRLVSRIDCPEESSTPLRCTASSDYGYFAEISLIGDTGDAEPPTLELGMFYVNPSEIVVGNGIGGRVNRRSPIKAISLVINNSPEFDDFIRENGAPLKFQVKTTANPQQIAEASAPYLAPYADTLKVGNHETTDLKLSDTTSVASCPGSLDNNGGSWIISGSSDWQPSEDDSWNTVRLDYSDICVTLDEDGKFNLQSGQIHIPQLMGDVGGIPVVAHNSTLDRDGARKPESVSIVLPDGHSWHEAVDGRPKARGSQSILVETGIDMNNGDFSSMEIQIGGGFIHARGLPFSMQAESMTLDQYEGLLGSIARFHYNFDQAYRESDPRHLDQKGPISNDSRFARPSTAEAFFEIDSDGLHIHELTYPAGQARTHYPRAQVNWDEPLNISIENGRIKHQQILSNTETYRFDFTGNCDGCADDGAEQTSYQLAAASSAGLAGDGAIAVQVNGLSNPSWGPQDEANRRRIFQRIGDDDLSGIFYLPGLIAEDSHDGWVVDYLMGARSIEWTNSAMMPGKNFQRFDSETRRGNHFQAGLTVGPEIYSDNNRMPKEPNIGSSLHGTSIEIGFGGLPKPAYHTISSNLASKYVIRAGGLTGVFNSDATPGQINAYDYELDLHRFAIRLVNNSLDSYNWLDGEIHVPGKGDFDINFSSLELTCSGDLGAGRIDREACGSAGNCGARLAAWQVPAELIGMGFKPDDPHASMCQAQSRRLEVVQSLQMARLTKPFGLQAFWSPDGDLLEHTISSTGDQQIDKPSDGELDGFALAPSAMQLKTPNTNSDTGWLEFQGLVGVPFWEAIKVDARVANKLYQFSGGEGQAQPASTVLLAEGKLPTAAGSCGNDEFLSGGCGGVNDGFFPKASYRWGNTGWGFDLPIEYDYAAVGKNELPRFLGIQKSIDLLVLQAQAGINFIDPVRTRLSFGASADFDKLRDAQDALDLQVDLGDPDTLRAVDSLLNKIGVSGSPLTNSLGSLHERLDLMNNLVGPALESAIKRAVLEGITRVGGEVTGGDPFEQLADGMSLVQSLPAQIANTVGDQLNSAMDRVTAPLVGPVDDALVNIYKRVPRIIERAPDNPTGDIVEEIREQLGYIRYGHSALNQADSALATAADGLNDTRAHLDSLRDQVSGWKGDITDALGTIQNQILDVGLKLSECNLGSASGTLSNHALIGPAIDSIMKTQEVAALMRSLEIAETIGVPVADLIDLDPEPIRAAERKINDLALAIEDRANQVLDAAEDALCPSGDSPFFDVLNKANDFLDEIHRGIVSIDQEVSNLHDTLSAALDGIDEQLQTLREPLATGHTFLANLEETLQSMLDDVPQYDYQGWATEQVQDAMDQLAQDAFGTPWIVDEQAGKSFLTPLTRQLREPVDLMIVQIQEHLQQQLASVAGQVPVKSADELRTMVANYVLDTPPVQHLLETVNTQTAAITEELSSLVTLALDQINTLVQAAAREVEAQVNEALAAASSALEGDLPMVSAGMDGYAVITGEELERAHLSAEWTMRGSADENTTSYNAALDITSWNANGKAAGCMPGDDSSYGSIMDATISTRNLPISIGPEEMMIRKLYLGFTLEDLKPKGVFGGIDTQGDLDFEAFTLYDIAFAAGVGAYENYIGASAGATFSSLQMSAAFLVGKTCNLEVLESLDPQVAEFITLPGGVFNGAYARGSASVPIWENGCALRVGVAADVGAWVLISPNLTVGGLVGGGAFGKVACLGALRGQVTAMGEKSGSSFSFAGEGFGVAGAGLKCKPETWTTVARSRENSWCGTVDASFGASYNDGWHVDGVKFSGIH